MVRKIISHHKKTKEIDFFFFKCVDFSDFGLSLDDSEITERKFIAGE